MSIARNLGDFAFLMAMLAFALLIAASAIYQVNSGISMALALGAGVALFSGVAATIGAAIVQRR